MQRLSDYSLNYTHTVILQCHCNSGDLKGSGVIGCFPNSIAQFLSVVAQRSRVIGHPLRGRLPPIPFTSVADSRSCKVRQRDIARNYSICVIPGGRTGAPSAPRGPLISRCNWLFSSPRPLGPENPRRKLYVVGLASPKVLPCPNRISSARPPRGCRMGTFTVGGFLQRRGRTT